MKNPKIVITDNRKEYYRKAKNHIQKFCKNNNINPKYFKFIIERGISASPYSKLKYINPLTMKSRKIKNFFYKLFTTKKHRQRKELLKARKELVERIESGFSINANDEST